MVHATAASFLIIRPEPAGDAVFSMLRCGGGGDTAPQQPSHPGRRGWGWTRRHPNGLPQQEEVNSWEASWCCLTLCFNYWEIPEIARTHNTLNSRGLLESNEEVWSERGSFLERCQTGVDLCWEYPCWCSSAFPFFFFSPFCDNGKPPKKREE